MGETSLGGRPAGWERRALNTRAPSRPESGRQDPRKWIFCPQIILQRSSRPPSLRLCPSQVFPAGWWVLKTRCAAAYRRHNNCQFEALENQAIRTQCAAGQYLNARENGSSLGQSVKIGQNCTGGTILPGIYRYYQQPKSCCVIIPIGSVPELAFPPSLQTNSPIQ